ncbi:unnamed protein product [Ambrosiozyma monospora]|uniref:Unnamed protein product n=1 Tax=Ambrosiozyma monospora TaxID=43982 RepID=A0ACB5TAA3_AMBMO|nr:unnamed protein product [Ambrosiozyma monospora]
MTNSIQSNEATEPKPGDLQAEKDGATMHPIPSGFSGFRDVDFVERTPLTHDVDHYKFTYHYSSDPSEPIPSLSVVLVRTPYSQRRWYTPIFNEDVGYVHLAIKNYERSCSGALAKMNPGDKGIQISNCKPHFTPALPFDKYKQVHLIGAGVGLSPLFQYMNSCLKDPNSTTKFKLIYSNHSEKDIIFKKDLEELQEKNPERVEIVHVLKTQTDGDKSKFVKYVGSRLDKEMLTNELAEGAGDDDVIALVCGPDSFVRMVAGRWWWYGGALRDIGYKKSQVFFL